jgi:hypothetical protein
MTAPSHDLGSYALGYAAAGHHVFPLKADKTPYTEHGMLEATDDIRQVEAWWDVWPDALIGCRVPADVVIIDVDPKADGMNTWRALRESFGAPPVTRTHRSGRGDGGGHLWFRHPGGKLSIRNLREWARERNLGQPRGKRSWTPGIDLLHHNHRYTILPPSPHPETGQPYTWPDGRGLDIDPAPLPDWLAELIVASDPPQPEPELRMSDAGDGETIADWYSRTATWNQILAPAGWTVQGGDGNADGSRWRHPEATSPISATVSNGCLFVYTDNTDFEPTEHGDPRGYTRFRAYALLHHGDDMADAARALRLEKDGPSVADQNRHDNFDWVATGQRDEDDEPPPTLVAAAKRMPEIVDTTQRQKPPLSVRYLAPPKPAATTLDRYADVEYPTAAWPPPVAQYIEAASVSLCSDPAMVGTYILPILATAIGHPGVLYVKDDWAERPRIYAAIISRPGTKKSPVISKTLAPLNEIQRELAQRYMDDHAAWKIADKDSRGAEPMYPAIIQSDATVEVFGRDMQGHPHGVILARDELSAWLRGMGQYKQAGGNDRQHWLEFWSGTTQRIRRIGLGSKTIIVDNPFVSVLGGIQPAIVGELLRGEDGFAQRFLYCIPEERPQDARSPSIPAQTTERYAQLLRDAYSAPTDARRSFGPVRCPPDARNRLLDEIQRTYDEKASGDLPPSLAEYWSKTEAYLARISVVLAWAWALHEGTQPTADDDIVAAAVALTDYYRRQAIEVFGDNGVAPPDAAYSRPGPKAEYDLADWLRRRGKTAFRDVRRCGPASFRKLDGADAKKLVDSAADRGLIIITKSELSRQFHLEAAARLGGADVGGTATNGDE